jgi:hypothetical protein
MPILTIDHLISKYRTHHHANQCNEAVPPDRELAGTASASGTEILEIMERESLVKRSRINRGKKLRSELADPADHAGSFAKKQEGANRNEDWRAQGNQEQ